MTNTPTPQITPEQRAELVKSTKVKAAMINLGEAIQWGSETILMEQCADQLEVDGVTIATLTAERDALEDSVVRLIAENFALSAWQCVFHDGRTGLVNDEHGNQYCAMQQKGAAT